LPCPSRRTAHVELQESDGGEVVERLEAATVVMMLVLSVVVRAEPVLGHTSLLPLRWGPSITSQVIDTVGLRSQSRPSGRWTVRRTREGPPAMSDHNSIASRYIDAWNMTDEVERRKAVGELFGEDARQTPTRWRR
jgi:hypothetical protein